MFVLPRLSIISSKPVFVDISLDDFCINSVQLESAITNKTRAIIVVHAFGLIAKMDEIMEVASRNNVKIIEDAGFKIRILSENKEISKKQYQGIPLESLSIEAIK